MAGCDNDELCNAVDFSDSGVCYKKPGCAGYLFSSSYYDNYQRKGNLLLHDYLLSTQMQRDSNRVGHNYNCALLWLLFIFMYKLFTFFEEVNILCSLAQHYIWCTISDIALRRLTFVFYSIGYHLVMNPMTILCNHNSALKFN